MKYNIPLIEGRLIKRYKRFLVDVELTNGKVVTAHCANTGAMTGCQPSGARVWLSTSDNPKRKYPHSWELVELERGALACINTSMTNRLVEEAIAKDEIAELIGYMNCQTEVAYGEERSRIDLLLSDAERQCYVEVKHVTLKLDNGIAAFPDAVTLRGQKHLRELVEQVKQGHRAVMLFIIMRTDVDALCPADSVDPVYGQLLRQASREGVEILAYKAGIDVAGLHVQHAVPVTL